VRPPVNISSEPARDGKPFLGRPCLFLAILIAIGRRLAGKKTTVFHPIVCHFYVVPGSLVCDVMLCAVPNGDVSNIRSTGMTSLTSKTVHTPVTYFDAMTTMSGEWVC
jgi:hypothetical protein